MHNTSGRRPDSDGMMSTSPVNQSSAMLNGRQVPNPVLQQQYGQHKPVAGSLAAKDAEVTARDGNILYSKVVGFEPAVHAINSASFAC
jgi:hypothetical protein